MPRKFSLGLGALGSLSNTTDGVTVSIFSGSSSNPHSDALVQISQNDAQLVRTISSDRSNVVNHSTLFEDFGLRATARYNFFEEDETSSETQDGEAPLSEIARYIEISWNPVPNREPRVARIVGSKIPTGVKPKSVVPLDQALKGLTNGYVMPGVVNALLVDPVQPQETREFNEELFLSSDDGSDPHRAIESKRFTVSSVAPRNVRIRARFVDPSIAGAIDEARIEIANDHVHLANMAAISKLIPGLEIVSEFNQDVPLRNPAPSFPAPRGTPTLTYVGYVLERFTLDEDGGMSLSMTTNIEDPSQVRYVDRSVRFGVRYSYRIRSIVQWVHDATVGFQGPSTLDRAPLVDVRAPSFSRSASYFAGDWSNWANGQVVDDRLPNPPEEIYIQPISRRRQVRIAWKMPEDPQRDVSGLTVVRATRSSGRLSDWKTIGVFPAANGSHVDPDVRAFEDGHETYVYAMYSTSIHGEISTLSELIEVTLTGRSRLSGELPLRRLRPPGGDPTVHPSDPSPPARNFLEARNRATMYIRGNKSQLPLFDRRYVVTVQSLSTGEVEVIDVSVDTTDVVPGA